MNRNLKTLIFLIFLILPILFGIFSLPSENFKYLGSADFIPPIRIIANSFTRLFLYFPNLYGGVDFSFLMPHLFPEYLLYFVLGLFGLTPAIITLIYSSSIIFMAEASMFLFLMHIFDNKFNLKSNGSRIIAAIFSIIFAFSPSYLSLIPPGHFIQTVPYALFPLLLLNIDKMLRNAVDKKTYLSIYLIFAFSATAFANVGIVYVIILTLCVYFLAEFLLNKHSVIHLVKNFIVLMGLMFLANSWWIIGYATTLDSLTNTGPESKINAFYINKAINIATKDASIFNIFLGKGESQLYMINSDLYTNAVSLVIFALVGFCFLYALIKIYRNKYVIILLIGTLIGVFLTKGPHKPFSDLYMWIYDNIIGFQIFRRPVSKYYYMFMFFYFSLSSIGAALILENLRNAKKRILFQVLLLVSVAYLVVIFYVLGKLTYFNVPEYIYESKKYLDQTEANKILLLPGTYGIQPMYDKTVNNLYISDLLVYIWDYQLVSPDATNSTPNEAQKQLINNLRNKLMAGTEFCSLNKKIGVTHIAVRENLSKEQDVEESVSSIHSILKNKDFIKEKKEFYITDKKGLTIYKLKDECTTGLVDVRGEPEVKFRYELVNPVKIKVALKKVDKNTIIHFYNNFRSQWNLYSLPYKSNYIAKNDEGNNSLAGSFNFFEIDDLSMMLDNKPLLDRTQFRAYDYANGWRLDSKSIRDSLEKSHYKENTDGSVDINLVIFYKKQFFVYFGFAFFLITTPILAYAYYASGRKKKN